MIEDFGHLLLTAHYARDKRVKTLEYRGLSGAGLPMIRHAGRIVRLDQRLQCDDGAIWHAFTSDKTLVWMLQPLDDRR